LLKRDTQRTNIGYFPRRKPSKKLKKRVWVRDEN
jgi:hypothetical protein